MNSKHYNSIIVLNILIIGFCVCFGDTSYNFSYLRSYECSDTWEQGSWEWCDTWEPRSQVFVRGSTAVIHGSAMVIHAAPTEHSRSCPPAPSCPLLYHQCSSIGEKKQFNQIG